MDYNEIIYIKKMQNVFRIIKDRVDKKIIVVERLKMNDSYFNEKEKYIEISYNDYKLSLKTFDETKIFINKKINVLKDKINDIESSKSITTDKYKDKILLLEQEIQNTKNNYNLLLDKSTEIAQNKLFSIRASKKSILRNKKKIIRFEEKEKSQNIFDVNTLKKEILNLESSLKYLNKLSKKESSNLFFK